MIKVMVAGRVTTKNAQIALPFILLISGIIVEIVIAGSLTSYFASGSGFNRRLEARASAVAYSGINDALMQISRNKEFGSDDPSYELKVNEDVAVVTFSHSSAGDYYVYTITSVGIAGLRETKVVAVAIVDKMTGKVQLQSLQEIAVQ